MPNGWSFNWESMATRERETLEMRCVESLLDVCAMCVLLSVIDAKRQLLCPLGANDQLALPQYFEAWIATMTNVLSPN
jgi:hypothetical protein